MQGDQDETNLERARNLFRFLLEAQRLRSKPVRRVDTYEAVYWLGDLPDQDTVWSRLRSAEPHDEPSIFTIERVPREEPPEIGEDLAPWLSGETDDADCLPPIAESLPAFRVPDLPPRVEEMRSTEADHEVPQVHLEDHPHIQAAYDTWSQRWESWAALERERREVRRVYADLFQTYVTAGTHSDEYELVLGVACIAWAPPGHDQVLRHLFTTPASISFDDDTGTLTVTAEPGPEPLSIELEMIEPELLKNPQHITRLKADVSEFQGHPLNREEVSQFSRQLVFALDPAASFDADDNTPRSPRPALAGTFAPALILRRRSQRGMVDVFETISRQLAEATEVPVGLLPLVDPDHRHEMDPDPAPGGMVSVDDEVFLPLPVNQQQLKVLHSVDTKSQTVVQGPPGTGKTHTAAALLTHLLAQGKRVLVTAQTDRALEEVREKLPEAIQPLSVAVIGSSRSDMADLKVAVDRISSRAAEHDSAVTSADIERSLTKIDVLKRRRSQTYGELLAARQREVDEHEQPLGSGTLSSLARQFQAESSEHEWISQYVEVEDGSSPPLSDAEMLEWLALLRDVDLAADSSDAQARLASPELLPTPDDVAAWIEAEAVASETLRMHQAAETHPAYESVRRLSTDQRSQMQDAMLSLADHIGHIESRPAQWMLQAIRDVRSGRPGAWQARAQQVDALVQATAPLVGSFGPLTRVQVLSGELPALRALAINLMQSLDAGVTIKVAPDGTPKINVLTPKPVKEARPLFDAVRVDGLPPTRRRELEQFVTYVDAGVSLGALERAWPAGTVIPEEDTLHERLQWHIGELQQLRAVLDLGQRINTIDSFVRSLGVPPPDWTDVQSMHVLASLVDAARARDRWLASQEPLDRLLRGLDVVTRWPDAGECVKSMRNAVADRRGAAYAAAYHRHAQLHECRRKLERSQNLGESLEATAPALRSAVEQDPHDESWTKRLSSFSHSWAWAATGSWIMKQQATDVNALQAQIATDETSIRAQVAVLAALRAWNHALDPERITGEARADLSQYAYLVRRLGKGTGKYAGQQRAEIRQAMERCRASVPVWIMPLYRIAEQFRVHENMFDVILVDEASQAGLDAIFLQYLAPKIVVVGDDKQVSPAAVGVDQEQLRSLANHYLQHDRYKASWQDPKRSLFDEAMMRYGNQITLVEHRRCVPEIIGFSNRIAYEPDNVRLIPVRQYGADRLEPIKVVHVPDGYTQGVSSRVNRPEVETIVHTIEKCLEDPAYDGLTMGVISLQGGAQAKAIEAELLTRLDPEVWDSRQLRCGDSADFQGSERNVMFLSMVATVEPERRLTALTADQYVQRYNVAASRAKDQMWVFHSMPLSELKNPEGMRFQLLDYCYGAAGRLASDDNVLKEAVPDDVMVPPFDSLFEQRVYNRLFDRGYSVVPQYPAEGYSIDLVVVGATRRLAIECDGDEWHGPDAYQSDLSRQRELERCGWIFHRIRESAFYLDEASVLTELWDALDELEIRPSGWVDARAHGLGEASSQGDMAEDLTGLREQGFVAADDEVDTELSSDTNDEGDIQWDDLHDDEFPDLTEYEETGIQWLWRSESADQPDETNGVISGDLELSAPRGGRSADGKSAISRHADPGLETYEAFTGDVVHPDRATKSDLVEGIVRIVAVEGPVLGSRLQTAYVRAAGGQRVGRNVARELNSAIYAAMRRGRILQSDSLGRQGLKFRTFRLPDQSAVLLRELGPRGIEEVPPNELAMLMEDEAQVCGWEDQRAIYKAVLTRYGLVRLTRNVEAVLDLAFDLVTTEAAPASIAADPVHDWTSRLLQSPQYAEQKVRAGRGSVADAIVQDVLIALIRLGGRSSFELIEGEAGLAAGSLRTVVPGLRRLLNLDGYEVLNVGDDGDLTLDSSMLSAQFGVTEPTHVGSSR